VDRGHGFAAAPLIASHSDNFHLVTWSSGHLVCWFTGLLVRQMTRFYFLAADLDQIRIVQPLFHKGQTAGVTKQDMVLALFSSEVIFIWSSGHLPNQKTRLWR
jgi:hypothetical protein